MFHIISYLFLHLFSPLLYHELLKGKGIVYALVYFPEIELILAHEATLKKVLDNLAKLFEFTKYNEVQRPIGSVKIEDQKQIALKSSHFHNSKYFHVHFN